MNDYLDSVIRKATGAHTIIGKQVIQSLWSGYGEIIRVELEGSDVPSVVVKHVQLQKLNLKAQNLSISHHRKVKSYQVEMEWYKLYSELCGEKCKVPKCLALDSTSGDVVLVLEDLDLAGYGLRKHRVNLTEMKQCLTWLADFHATFLGVKPTGLWNTGTYWHLETRPEELEALNDLPLKNAASLIDLKLKSSPFQTLVHGDAKLANFCFSEDSKKVAAVDFQYVGAGVGMKDLAYFVSSCLDEEINDHVENEILDTYFLALKTSLVEKGKRIDPYQLEENWRSLYGLAWTDFYRFWKGWAAGSWHKNCYSERISKKVISKIERESSK